MNDGSNFPNHQSKFVEDLERIFDRECYREKRGESSKDGTGAVYELCMAHLYSRGPFITRTGFVGMCPSHVEVGDVVCVFQGGKLA